MPRTREEIDAEKARKPRPDLIPAGALLDVGRAMAYGYDKHGECTWTEAGTQQADPRTHIASAMRHLLEHIDDPDAVEEGSGLPVLVHAATQVLIALDCVRRAEPARKAATRTRRLPKGWHWDHTPGGWRATAGQYGTGAHDRPEDAAREAHELNKERKRTMADDLLAHLSQEHASASAREAGQ